MIMNANQKTAIVYTIHDILKWTIATEWTLICAYLIAKIITWTNPQPITPVGYAVVFIIMYILCIPQVLIHGLYLDHLEKLNEPPAAILGIDPAVRNRE